jgi:hypothetical protein
LACQKRCTSARGCQPCERESGEGIEAGEGRDATQRLDHIAAEHHASLGPVVRERAHERREHHVSDSEEQLEQRRKPRFAAQLRQAGHRDHQECVVRQPRQELGSQQQADATHELPLDGSNVSSR